MNTNKVRGKATGVRVRPKIERWVKYTYRVFFTDGTSKYMTRSIAKFEGCPIEHTRDYLVRDFAEYVKHDPELTGMKLISVDGQKYNIMVS